MARIRISKTILDRVAQYEGLKKNLKAFVEACQNSTHPPRVYKASGISANGQEYYPYLALDLHHHHLHNNGDPLLITQHVGGDIFGFALTRHADFFQGDKMQWLKDHAEMIDWTGLETLHRDVMAYNQKSECC